MSQDPQELSRHEIAKKVDESWKDSVQKEKASASPAASESGASAPADRPTDPRFVQFLSSLGMQALMFLGEVEDPLTGAASVDLQQAKYLIDVLRSIQHKTQGNLSAEESQTFQALLYELQLKYSDRAKSGAV